MKIKLAYGNRGLEIELCDKYYVDIIKSKYLKGLPSPIDVIRNSLLEPYDSLPLKEVVSNGDKVGIVFSDITRPVSSKLILPIIINEISENKYIKIILFNALGTHRENTDKELRFLLGDEIVNNYRIVQNNAFDLDTHQNLGVSSNGTPIYLNSEMVSCDVVVLTGLLEPHFFAGFSGGGKSIMPGMAGLETILGNHNSQMIANAKAKFGITSGNPVWEEILEISSKVNETFLVNMTMNSDREITGIFSGNINSAHDAGCKFLSKVIMVAVDDLYDIVITTNSGYPLDLNLYQSVKGMSAAVSIVRKGGDIIIATECRDGLPDYGYYSKLLGSYDHPEEVLEAILSSEQTFHDQWQVQIQTQIQSIADIYVYSDFLTDQQIQSMHMIPCRNIRNTISVLSKKYNGNPRIGIIPDGPQTIPYLKDDH